MADPFDLAAGWLQEHLLIPLLYAAGLYLNPAFCSFQAFKLGIMDRNVFGGGLRSVIHNFKGDGSELLDAIKLLGYPEDFTALCKQLLAERPAK